MTKKVLILCTGNSCRSQMAEVILNKLGQGDFEAVSAGSRPAGYVHPLALSLLQERGYRVGGLRSKSLDEFRGRKFDAVITVCDRAQEACPAWPGAKMIHWSFEDPALAQGPDERKRAVFEKVYGEIEARLRLFVAAGVNEGS